MQRVPGRSQSALVLKEAPKKIYHIRLEIYREPWKTHRKGEDIRESTHVILQHQNEEYTTDHTVLTGYGTNPGRQQQRQNSRHG